MGKFVAGDVVVVAFPFSNLKAHKHRPALILAPAEFDDLILCQITSKSYSSSTAIPLVDADFENGRLPLASFIRPDKIFTADSRIITKKAGSLQAKKFQAIKTQVRSIFN